MKAAGGDVRHVTLRIEGRVQGVGFRWYTRHRAAQLGVSGFVRNEDDGSVYIEAEADASTLESFQQWCHKGPSSALVERVVVQPGPVRGFAGFTVAE